MNFLPLQSLSNFFSDQKSKRVDVGDAVFKLTMWDTGHDNFRASQEPACANARGLLVVFDLASEDSFCYAQVWLKNVYKFAPKWVTCALIGHCLHCDGDHADGNHHCPRRVSSDMISGKFYFCYSVVKVVLALFLVNLELLCFFSLISLLSCELTCFFFLIAAVEEIYNLRYFEVCLKTKKNLEHCVESVAHDVARRATFQSLSMSSFEISDSDDDVFCSSDGEDIEIIGENRCAETTLSDLIAAERKVPVLQLPRQSERERRKKDRSVLFMMSRTLGKKSKKDSMTARGAESNHKPGTPRKLKSSR